LISTLLPRYPTRLPFLHVFHIIFPIFFFFFIFRRPPRSTLFPTRRSSDLCDGWCRPGAGGGFDRDPACTVLLRFVVAASAADHSHVGADRGVVFPRRVSQCLVCPYLR